MSEPYRLPAKIACRVARIDRQRLNEHVASGAYYIAPDPARGGSRYFLEEDAIPLYVFARLTERGLNSKKAGNVASMLHDALRHGGTSEGAFKGEQFLVICHSINGSTFLIGGSRFFTAMAAGETVNPYPYQFEVFDLTAIRTVLNSAIDYERSIVGGADDE